MQTIFQDIEEALKKECKNKITHKRIFNILVELVQNIYNYNCSRGAQAPEVLVMVQRTDEGYEVITGNNVEQEKLNNLESRLRIINYLDEELLDEVYKGVLLRENSAKETGAGLGFLDVIRKSGNVINFNIDAVDEGAHFLTIKSLVKIN